MRAQWRHCLLGAAVLLVAGPGRAQEYRTARVSDVRGGLVVRGVSEDEFSYVERNAVLREGDTLWTDDKGSAEAELEYGSWLRLAEETKVELRGLPPTGELHLWAGSLYLDLSPQMPDGFRVRTPAGDIDVRPESVVRVDLSRDEQVRISVVHGLARVRTDGRGTELVGAGERAYLLGGRVPDPPGLYNRQDRDSFDHYHYGRVDYYVRRPVPAELDRGLVGARDLYDNGSWVVVDNSRYWRPRCDPGWRPYSAGYWSYLPDCGYTWVDYAPWGYLTSHYGRWLYRPTYGWLWSPGYTWGPSYVAWSSFGGYCGWAPLDPWNQPCYYGNFGGFVPGGGFGLSFGLGNVFVDFRSWTFCDYNRFYFGRHHRQYWNNGPVFVTANQIHLDPNGFRFGNDALSQIGVPRERFRGLVAINGEEAKRRALRFDQAIPSERLKRIESRFQVPALRDVEKARSASRFAALQRAPSAKIGEDAVLRGSEAVRQLSPAFSGTLKQEGLAGLRPRGSEDRGLPERDRESVGTRPLPGLERKPGPDRGDAPGRIGRPVRDREEIPGRAGKPDLDPGLPGVDPRPGREVFPGRDRKDIRPGAGEADGRLEREFPRRIGEKEERSERDAGLGREFPRRVGEGDSVPNPGGRAEREFPRRIGEKELRPGLGDGTPRLAPPTLRGDRDAPFRRDGDGATFPGVRGGTLFPGRDRRESGGGSPENPFRRDLPQSKPGEGIRFPAAGSGTFRREESSGSPSTTPRSGDGDRVREFPRREESRSGNGAPTFPRREEPRRSPEAGSGIPFPRRDEGRPSYEAPALPRRDEGKSGLPRREESRPSYGTPSFPRRSEVGSGDPSPRPEYRPSYRLPDSSRVQEPRAPTPPPIGGGSAPGRGLERPSYGGNSGSFPRGNDSKPYGGSGSSGSTGSLGRSPDRPSYGGSGSLGRGNDRPGYGNSGSLGRSSDRPTYGGSSSSARSSEGRYGGGSGSNGGSRSDSGNSGRLSPSVPIRK